ncbi:MAG: hypothetical protein WCP93_00820 [Candidatus Berkelbacteria bacterium]
MHKKEWFFSVINILLVLLVLTSLVFLVVKIVNPNKYLDKTRDAKRLNDLTSLQTAIDLYIADGQNFDQLTSSQTYKSLVRDDSLGGQGWLPLNFKLVSSGVPIDFLPVDPTNQGDYYYKFGVNLANKTYEIDCRFESPSFIYKAKNDGGNNSDWYELGTDLTILK